ncbi:MAG: ATP-binding cassette domain-containing protein [Mycoplasmataceae bacterium]|jgi:energy-coupling factor transport system ATP-binding protein|nr:ATP-binding cassette domain-containing protein [Mycoplasmataceae bacterium]
MSQKVEFNQAQYALTAKDLKIIFDEKSSNENVVLETFNYQFHKNKIYFIIGNSGSGKTSLVSHFNGLLKSKYGDLTVGSLNILAKKRKIKHFKELRKTVGMVFQFPEYQLFKDTIEKDVIFGPINLGIDKETAKQKAKHYLNLLGLDDTFLQRSPFSLSGGQKRRVALAGILAIEPHILVFDEPTAGLDPAGETEMIKIIQSLKDQGKTIFIITHVMDHVLSIGDEVLVLGNKKLIASGKPYDIFTNHKLISQNSLDIPKVIHTINKLISLDSKYKVLFTKQPRNIYELAQTIGQLKRSKNE